MTEILTNQETKSQLLKNNYVLNTDSSRLEKNIDSIFVSNTSTSNKKESDEVIKLTTQNVDKQMEAALSQEKSKVQSQNLPILQNGLKTAIEKFTDTVISQVISLLLQNERLDLAQLAQLPDLKGINGGKGFFGIAGITNTSLNLNGKINDPVMASFTASNGQTYTKTGYADSSLSIDTSFNEGIIKKEILSYFNKKDYFSEIKQMKPGEEKVFENNLDGKRAVWAEKRNGKIFIYIIKNGLNLNIVLDESNVGQAKELNQIIPKT